MQMTFKRNCPQAYSFSFVLSIELIWGTSINASQPTWAHKAPKTNILLEKFKYQNPLERVLNGLRLKQKTRFLELSPCFST